MLLLLLEKGMPLDEVIFYNSEMEFQAIYDIRDRMRPVLEQRGIRLTEVKTDAPFLYNMLQKKWLPSRLRLVRRPLPLGTQTENERPG